MEKKAEEMWTAIKYELSKNGTELYTILDL